MTTTLGRVTTDTGSFNHMADDTHEDEGGRKGRLFMLLVALGSAAAFLLKKKRDQELDEALWEEPRAL